MLCLKNKKENKTKKQPKKKKKKKHEQWCSNEVMASVLISFLNTFTT